MHRFGRFPWVQAELEAKIYSSWDPERRGWQPKDKNTRTERRAEKRSTRIRSRLRKRRDAGSAAEKRRRRKRDRRINARSRRNDAQHR
ncbi:hypothetical protein NDU88_011525 [Pleurodeles waltl]|uniref:Uncharacterized protein n=1 Tax=Pleurodeles waltl TaxID=8319 RepID=A0AAV7S427_PLEWA|nr:hypothetical protein NDU88_011525 [Pleurodeles waltl]